MRRAEVELLFGYLYWLRDRVCSGASSLDPAVFRAVAGSASRSVRDTLVHELDIEMGWRERLRGSPGSMWSGELSADAYPTVDALLEHWRDDETRMREWIGSISDEEIGAPVTVNGLDGYAMAYYLLHVITHGIQELEDAGVLLGHVGAPVRDLGFLCYVDTVRGPEAGPAAQP